MFIAAYAGAGKTTFAKNHPAEAADVCSMPYCWLLPDDCGGSEERESLKAANYMLNNPAFPYNYFKALFKAAKEYKYVLLPPITSVLTGLECIYDLPYIMCVPDIGLKEEYRERYVRRGNSADFIDIFCGEWDLRIRCLDIYSPSCGMKLELGAGMFLDDIKEQIDRVIAERGEPCGFDFDKEITAASGQAEEMTAEACLKISHGARSEDRSWYYLPLDLSLPENRRWAIELAREFNGRGAQLTTDNYKLLEEYYAGEIVKLRDREELTELLRSVSA